MIGESRSDACGSDIVDLALARLVRDLGRVAKDLRCAAAHTDSDKALALAFECDVYAALLQHARGHGRHGLGDMHSTGKP